MTDRAPATAAPPSPPEAAPRSPLRRALLALLVYAAVRAAGVAVLALWSAAKGKSWHTLLTARWDSLWYAGVAEHGYGHTVRLPDGGVHSDLAFFPLLPWLERGVSALSPLSAADAGMVVSWLASLFAAWALYAIGERLYGPRVGVVLVVLWAVLPVGVVQSMAYSESLFTALAAGGVYCVLSRRWVRAGVLAAAAGLTRPVGAAVVAAVWITAVVELWRERRATGSIAWERHRHTVLGVVLAPLGWVGYVLWVGTRTGGITGYVDVQGGWGNGFDGGLAFASFIGERLAGSGTVFLAGLGPLVGVALVIGLYALCVRRGQPPPLLVYCGVVLLLALTAKGYLGSKPRLMMPAFPLLLPIAGALARWRPARSGALLTVVALASATYGAFWLNGSGPP